MNQGCLIEHSGQSGPLIGADTAVREHGLCSGARSQTAGMVASAAYFQSPAVGKDPKVLRDHFYFQLESNFDVQFTRFYDKRIVEIMRKMK